MSQLVHTARQMFESRIAKYNDPHNLDWDWDDIMDKWERHAFSAYMDLVETEKQNAALVVERDRLLQTLKELRPYVAERDVPTIDAAIALVEKGKEKK